jgi:phage baseplate assembly protein W
MAAISFKSVGEVTNNPRSVQTVQPKPVGIITPVIYSRKVGGPVEMSTAPLDQIIDNFRNMLLTNHGERLPLYDFGANLRVLLTERLAQSDYDERAMMLVKATTEKYMPYVSLNTFETSILSTDQNGISKLKITVVFSIPRASSSSKTVEIILTNIG